MATCLKHSEVQQQSVNDLLAVREALDPIRRSFPLPFAGIVSLRMLCKVQCSPSARPVGCEGKECIPQSGGIRVAAKSVGKQGCFPCLSIFHLETQRTRCCVALKNLSTRLAWPHAVGRGGQALSLTHIHPLLAAVFLPFLFSFF